MAEVYLDMYDYIIVTHIPAFYKVNLYNELAKKLNILVVFIASNTAEKRADDFVTFDSATFKYEVLFDGNFQDRDIISNIKKLKTILKNNQYKRLLVSGWDLKEFWYLVMLCPKSKNCLALESTILESTPKGFKGWVKKVFLFRISTVFASGNLHVKLLKALSFKGDIKITKGVGIINKPAFEKKQRVYRKRFLFVGRLTRVKNLETLIKVFNELPNYHLTLIGDGEEKEYLQSIANQNISFKPPIENSKLQIEFLNHDIFILPSISEPWGLVVEEALYFGMPVMVSENCGASELVKNGENGFIFNPLDVEGIKNLILSIDDFVFKRLIQGVSEFSTDEKDLKQVYSYAIVE